MDLWTSLCPQEMRTDLGGHKPQLLRKQEVAGLTLLHLSCSVSVLCHTWGTERGVWGSGNKNALCLDSCSCFLSISLCPAPRSSFLRKFWASHKIVNTFTPVSLYSYGVISYPLSPTHLSLGTNYSSHKLLFIASFKTSVSPNTVPRTSRCLMESLFN